MPLFVIDVETTKSVEPKTGVMYRSHTNCEGGVLTVVEGLLLLYEYLLD